jgi:HAD superfamily hydrolase (TIGR01509 family)
MHNIETHKTQFATIFDLNGTLIDDGKYQEQAFYQLLGEKIKNGEIKSPTPEESQALHGRPTNEILDILFGRKLSQEEQTFFGVQKDEIYRELYRPHIELVPGTSKFLSELKEDNVPVALATSAIKANADLVLDGANIRQYFNKIVTADDVQHGKPDPEIYLTAAAALGYDPKKTVVFEDAPSGVKAGKAAGALVVGLTTMVQADKLRQAGADLTIDNFSALNVNDIEQLIEK